MVPVRISLALIISGCVCLGHAQAQSVDTGAQKGSDAALYESFFRSIVRLKQVSDHPQVMVNGGNGKIVLPKVNDVIGLTDDQVAALNSIAVDCIANVDRLLRPQAAIFEARLEEMESGRV